MKRLCILAITLILLTGCGRPAESPEEPTTDETTVVTTTQAPTTERTETTVPAQAYSLTAQPKNPSAKPFTKDDITAIEQNFKTVGDYVRAVPAVWYDVEYWYAVGGGIRIDFYNAKPEDDRSESFLSIFTRDDVPGITDVEDVVVFTAQELPKALLAAENAIIHRVDFAKTGTAISPPRGLAIGDNAQKILEAYPDYRLGDGDILYDITTLYPWAKPEWGNTEWDAPDGQGWMRAPEYGFLGGRIWKENSYYITRFIFMEKPCWWDERSMDQPWTSDIYSYYWKLDYYVEENTIQGIEYMLLYHPN